MNDTDDIDRRKLMAEALAQTGSIADAIALVERVLTLSETSRPILTPPVQAPRKPRSDIGLKRKPRNDLGSNRKPWTEQEIALGNHMLAMDKTNIEIGAALNRSFKAISSAISRGILDAPNTPKRAGSRRGAYIGALKRGRNIHDYAKAEAILGKLVTPTEEQVAKEKFEAAIDQLLINGADVHEVVSNMKF